MGLGTWVAFLFILTIALIFLGIPMGYLNLGLKTISASNFEKNYEWFKDQETSIRQLDVQVCQAAKELDIFKAMYGTPMNWTKNLQDQYADLQYVKNGYVSKYNALVAQYNAHRASFIRDFGRDANTPKEYAEYYDAQCAQ